MGSFGNPIKTINSIMIESWPLSYMSWGVIEVFEGDEERDTYLWEDLKESFALNNISKKVAY